MSKKNLVVFSISAVSSIAVYALYKIFQPNANKLNVVFDLDSTLIYACKFKKFSAINMKHNPKYFCSLKKNKNENNNYYVWIRPYCLLTLWFLSKFNNLYICTKAKEDYATDICSKTNINKYILSNHYVDNDNKIKKDLDLILPNVQNHMKILIDDNNLNHIKSQHFYHIPNFTFLKKYDCELLYVCAYVIKLNIYNDIFQIFKFIK